MILKLISLNSAFYVHTIKNTDCVVHVFIAGLLKCFPLSLVKDSYGWDGSSLTFSMSLCDLQEKKTDLACFPFLSSLFTVRVPLHLSVQQAGLQTSSPSSASWRMPKASSTLLSWATFPPWSSHILKGTVVCLCSYFVWTTMTVCVIINDWPLSPVSWIAVTFGTYGQRMFLLLLMCRLSLSTFWCLISQQLLDVLSRNLSKICLPPFRLNSVNWGDL